MYDYFLGGTDNFPADPVVTSHGRALLAGDEGTAVVDADVRDPEGVLGDPRVAELIAAGRPVCVLLVAVLHFFTDEQDPAGLLARYRDAVPHGSHIIVSHADGEYTTDAGWTAVAHT